MWNVGPQCQDLLHSQSRDKVDLRRVKKRGRPWTVFALKILGQSTLQSLRGNSECSNVELVPQQRWRHRTNGPNADHKAPHVSSHAEHRRLLGAHLDHRTNSLQLKIQHQYRRHLRHCAKGYQSG